VLRRSGAQPARGRRRGRAADAADA
jgi:hypothetical protein